VQWEMSGPRALYFTEIVVSDFRQKNIKVVKVSLENAVAI
jgi:hypothetical protein